MFCFKCGANMPDTSTACPACGTPVQKPATPAAAGTQVSTLSGGGTIPSPFSTGAAQGTAAAQQPAQPGRGGTQPVSPWLNVPPAPAHQETDGKAVASLILGILAILPLGILAGIPAVILGHLSKAEIRKSMGRLKGEGMALGGLIMGYFSVAFLPIVLIIAAIAIPSFLRAKQAANESVAASTVRMLNTAQLSYSTEYGQGFGSSLDVLGNGGATCTDRSAQHACLVDTNFTCGPVWCFKNGYSYHMAGICGAQGCTDYVITATPLNSGSGNRNFCSTSDGIVRFRRGSVLSSPLESAEECTAWAML